MRSNTSGERDINPTNHCPCQLHRCSLKTNVSYQSIRASPPITISNILTVITVNAVQTILWQNFCRFSFSFHKIKKFWAKGNPDIFTWIYIYKDSVITTVIIYRCNWSSGCDYWSEWQEKSELLTLVSNLSTPLECCFTGSQSHICLNLKSSQTSSSSSSAS